MYQNGTYHPYQEPTVSVRSLLQKGKVRLEEGGIDEAQLNAELLLCEILKVTRTGMRGIYDRAADNGSVEKYENFIARRLRNEPLQYIVEGTEFMGFWLKIDNRVFIPRPETELLAETVINRCRSVEGKIPRILDIGTGSGNISLAVARAHPLAVIDAIDSDRDALAVADENIKLYNLADRIRLINYDILNGQNQLGLDQYDIIVSNPPYIPYDEYLKLSPEVRDYEPPHACTDGNDGLTFYHKITQISADSLKYGGAIIVEIGCEQGETVSDIFISHRLKNIEIWKDYNNHDRIIQGER